jgi:hypothetical protein
MRWLVIVIAFISISVSCSAQKTLTDTVVAAYDSSEFIFIGKVKGMNSPPNNTTRIYDFEVVEIYKGKRWSNVIIISDVNNFQFEANKEYLVYSYHEMVPDKHGKPSKSGYLASHRNVPVENDKALPDVKELVKILKKKPFGRIKLPRPKIIFRKCNCSHEKI